MPKNQKKREIMKNLLKTLLVIATLLTSHSLNAKKNLKDIPNDWYGFFNGAHVTIDTIGMYLETSEYDGGIVHWFEKDFFNENEDGDVSKYVCTYILPTNPEIGGHFYSTCDSVNILIQHPKHGPADYDYTFDETMAKINVGDK